MDTNIGILGTGYALPPTIRYNDDPIFENISATTNSQGVSERDLFTGVRQRRVLSPGESLEELMISAGQQALEQAGLSSAAIDRLYGYGSVSEFVAPNGLYKVHAGLGLRTDTMVVPINAEFTNFTKAVILAWEALLAGHCRHVMVVMGSGWTRNMDYTQAHSFQVGDAAGAIILGRSDKMIVIDYLCGVWSDEYGLMTMKYRGARDSAGNPVATYAIEPEEGRVSILKLGMNGIPAITKRLLDKYAIRSKDISLIVPQPSKKLMDHWNDQIQPKYLLSTFYEYGHMPVANQVVTIAKFYAEMQTPYLVICSIGVPTHIDCLLLKV